MPEQDSCPLSQQFQQKIMACPGAWRLAPQRAIRLMPRRQSQIMIVQGHAWITWESDTIATPGAELDRFLSTGQVLDVPAGVRLVMESVDSRLPVDFNWRTMPPELAVLPPASLHILLQCWYQAWLGLVRASARLTWGLVQRFLQGRRWRSGAGPAH